MSGEPGFFDLDERYGALSAAGDPLLKLSSVIDFELFRPALKRALRRSDRGKGGRAPFDAVLMFKILVLQALYNLSDDQTEFQIRDRLSFMRFLGLGLQIGFRTPRRSGCSASFWCGPRRSRGCSIPSTITFAGTAIWRWRGN